MTRRIIFSSIVRRKMRHGKDASRQSPLKDTNIFRLLVDSEKLSAAPSAKYPELEALQYAPLQLTRECNGMHRTLDRLVRNDVFS